MSNHSEISQIFSFMIFLSIALICCIAFAALLVRLYCTPGSLLRVGHMCQGKHVLGIAVDPSLVSCYAEMFLPQGLTVPRYQVEELHFLSLWAGSWPRGKTSLLAPGGLNVRSLSNTTCSTTAPDGAAVGPVEECVCLLCNPSCK